VAKIGMYGVGKINRRRSLGEILDISLRRENKNPVFKEIDF
jgi:hypothetical protein